jgi:hypothetical protein
MEAAKPAPDRWRLLSRWLGVSVATMLLAEELIEPEEARQAGVISGRFGPDGWDAESAREPGPFFDQERAMIARAQEGGQLSEPESADLRRVLEDVELKALAKGTGGWRAATFRKDLPNDATAATIARAAVIITAAGIPEQLLTDAELLTSELVTNSIRHGPDDAEVVNLQVSLDRDVLRVEVSDDSPRAATPRAPDERGGWGLARARVPMGRRTFRREERHLVRDRPSAPRRPKRLTGSSRYRVRLIKRSSAGAEAAVALHRIRRGPPP